jgi:hypothetical protein
MAQQKAVPAIITATKTFIHKKQIQMIKKSKIQQKTSNYQKRSS